MSQFGSATTGAGHTGNQYQPNSYPAAVGDNNNAAHQDNHGPALPKNRLPLNPTSSLLRSLAVCLFMVYAGMCMHALVSPYWYSSKSGADTGLVLSPFYACTRAPKDTFGCSDLQMGKARVRVSSTGCETSTEEFSQWMYLIRFFVLLSGSASGVTSLLLIGNLAIYPIAKAALPIASIAGGCISLASWAISVAATVVGISDKLTCGEGLCGTDTTCKEFWMSGAWVLFIGGIVCLLGLGVAIADYARRMLSKTKGAVPPAHHQNAPSTHQQPATSNYPQPDPVMQQQSSPQQDYRQEPQDYQNKNSGAQYQSHSQEMEQVAAPASDATQYHHEGFELPEGDWEWDPASNMYWSESQYLFLNPQNSHFYDPNSSMWYNAETEEWYNEGEQ
jgi:hypothetical protein